MKDLQNKDLLFNMLKIASPSGDELEIQKYLIEAMKNVDDKVYTHHNMNVVHAINPDSSVKILLAGHVDEISLVIEEIRSNGTCRLCSNGGIKPYVYLGQHVNVYHVDEDGNRNVVPGVITYLPHMDKGVSVNDLILELGVDSKEEAEKLVRIGDAVCHKSDYVELANGRLAARALDDRLGAFICLEAMRRAKERGCKNGVYTATTVGEETNGRGASAAADQIKPVCSLIVDVTYASDINYRENLTNPISLGKGPGLTRCGYINKKLEKLVSDAAKKLNMRVQYEIATSRTYTDGDSVYHRQGGIPTYLFNIPLRYMHSAVEVCDYQDVEDIIELMTEVIMSIDENTSFNPFE